MTLNYEHKHNLLATRDELYEAWLDAHARLEQWQHNGHQLSSSTLNERNNRLRRKEVVEYLQAHMAELSSKLVALDSLISPTYNTAQPCD